MCMSMDGGLKNLLFWTFDLVDDFTNRITCSVDPLIRKNRKIMVGKKKQKKRRHKNKKKNKLSEKIVSLWNWYYLGTIFDVVYLPVRVQYSRKMTFD